MTHLCQLASDWRGTTPIGGMMFEQKFDGWRALRFHGIDGVARLFTRNGMILNGCAHIERRLAAIEEAYGERLMIDGELVVDGTLEATKRWAETGWRAGGDRGVFHAFDVVPFSAWQRGGWDEPLVKRKALLEALIKASEPVSDGWTWPAGSKGAPTPIAVRLVKDGWATDAGDVLDEARRVWASAGEGIMLKDAEAPYRRTRNDAWQKVKRDNYTKWRNAA